MSYERINWEDAPSTETPINAENLNKMDIAIEDHDKRLELIEKANVVLNGNISDVYNATLTYTIGDYRIHDNVLYKCTVDITEPEAFNAEHWKPTTIITELNLIMAEISELRVSLGTQVIHSLSGTTLTMTTK